MLTKDQRKMSEYRLLTAQQHN